MGPSENEPEVKLTPLDNSYRINKLDHIWLVAAILVLVIAVWTFTGQPPFLADLAKSLMGAFVMAATAHNAARSPPTQPP